MQVYTAAHIIADKVKVGFKSPQDVWSECEGEQFFFHGKLTHPMKQDQELPACMADLMLVYLNSLVYAHELSSRWVTGT